MLQQRASASRLETLVTVAKVAVALLLAKVLATTVLEYRRYFPADFEATFLIGRREYFAGIYAAAFYTHIISGPLTLLLGAFLLWSGLRRRYQALHRWLGRVQVLLILAALVPSGAIMAWWAFAGPIAGIGFWMLSLATAVSAIALVYYARAKQYMLHERWAQRCYLLLISTLLLRIVGGALTVAAIDTPVAYRLNAWLSWLIPLAVYEVWWGASLSLHRLASNEQSLSPFDDAAKKNEPQITADARR